MQQKILLFDFSSAQAPKHGSKFGGMILYATTVFIHLVRNLKPGIVLKALYIPDNYAVPRLYDICKEYGVEMVPTSETTIIDTVLSIKPDLFFTPNPTKNRIVDSDDVHMLTVCHDIRMTEICYDPLYWRFCESWGDWVFLFDSILLNGFLQKRNMLNTAKRYIGRKNISFIAVSQHTKHHIMVHFPQYFNKEIPVFFSPMLELIDENSEEINFGLLPDGIQKGKYFFMDSGWRWSKNDLRAAIAIDRMFSKHPELKMKCVITGVKNPKPFMHYLKNKEQFVLMQYVDRDVLNSLHKEAYCTIYPTLGEGFGYTPMESFKYGVPVIAACNSSVPEVCGDAVLYVNPYSLQELENRCLQMLDPNVHDSLSKKSVPRYEFIFAEQKNHLDQLVQYIQDKTLGL